MLDELERLERAATPGRWDNKGRILSDLWGADDRYIGHGFEEWDAALIAAARNALPALLRVARAAREWEEAQRVYTGLFESSAYESEVSTAEHRLNRAEDDLRAAIAALTKAPRHDP